MQESEFYKRSRVLYRVTSVLMIIAIVGLIMSIFIPHKVKPVVYEIRHENGQRYFPVRVLSHDLTWHATLRDGTIMEIPKVDCILIRKEVEQ